MDHLYQLECFGRVAETENISEAARALHISQPSLSQMIRRMEEDLGYPLFDRRGKRVVLNENGRILLEAARRMQEIYAGAKRAMEENNARAHREVSVYIGCASMHLPQLLEHLKQRTPQIKYHIFQWREKGMRADDIGVVALDGNGAQYFSGDRGVCDGTCYEVLFEEKLVLAMPADHPLAARAHIEMADLMEEDFICLDENWVLGRLVQQHFQKLPRQPKTAIWVDNPSLMRDLLRKGMGIAFVPSVSWKGFGEESVVMRQVEDFIAPRTVCICYRQDKYITLEEKACMDGIREYFAGIEGQAREIYHF